MDQFAMCELVVVYIVFVETKARLPDHAYSMHMDGPVHDG